MVAGVSGENASRSVGPDHRSNASIELLDFILSERHSKSSTTLRTVVVDKGEHRAREGRSRLRDGVADDPRKRDRTNRPLVERDRRI